MTEEQIIEAVSGGGMMQRVISLKNNPEFHKILSFINTADSKQMKGAEGHER